VVAFPYLNQGRLSPKEPTGYESPVMWLWFRNTAKRKVPAAARWHRPCLGWPRVDGPSTCRMSPLMGWPRRGNSFVGLDLEPLDRS